MDHSIYKLEFTTGVHFGSGMLNDSELVFEADQLFSALYLEALKAGNENDFLEAVRSGSLLFSDALPYAGSQYMLPKPVLYIEHEHKGDSSEKKQFKRLKFIQAEKMEDFLKGDISLADDPMENFGTVVQQTMVSVRNEKEASPFHVGTYYFHQGNGLYIIAAVRSSKEKILLEELLESLSFTGVGGKKSAGLGKYTLKYGRLSDVMRKMLQEEARVSMLLSCALPKETELAHALEGASYLLKKRSGFVASETYANEQRKKKDLYVFAPGSCFENRFEGDVYDVSENGRHPVYRYAKPMFVGVLK